MTPDDLAAIVADARARSPFPATLADADASLVRYLEREAQRTGRTLPEVFDAALADARIDEAAETATAAGEDTVAAIVAAVRAASGRALTY